MYWIPSSAFQMGQTYAIRNDTVRELIGLRPLGVPRGAAGAPPPAQKAEVIHQPSSQQGQKSPTPGVLPPKKISEVAP